MKKLFISVLALAGLAACYNENVVSESSSLAPITFGDVFVEKATRAEDPSKTTGNIKEFYVWAVMDEQDGTVFADERIHKSGDVWTYEQTATWAPGHTYYFAALAAKRAEGATEFTNLDINFTSEDVDPEDLTPAHLLGTVTFTNYDGTDDILYAECERETANPMSSAPEAVKFQFNHLLSKIKFTFINGFENENDTVVVTDVKIQVPKVGTIDLTQDNYTWNPSTEKLALEMGNVNGGEKIGINQSISTNERFTIPASKDMTYTVTFKVETFAGSVRRTEATKTIELKGYEFGVGNAYNLVATINKDNAAENPMYDIVFNVEVDEWAEQEPEELTFYDPETNTANINTIKDLQYISEAINNNSFENIENIKIFLSNDIDLNDYYITRSGEPTTSNWAPIGTEENPFTGTFDGNGHTIKNLTLVEPEAKEGKAYIGFFGYAKNATIKNVTFENVYINIPCLDIDHSQGHIGAVAGSLEGTSTIENVTVKGDIKVYATQNANGASRVAVVAGGNSYGDVTMRNVHVIANEDSYLIANNNTGALAGQLQGKALFENCSSNIDVTVNKFFAGGLIGIAAGDQTFINCHTTGDVAVVAGREGRNHDQYRVGGIAGGWADGKNKVCTLTNCSYTGKVSGKNSDGSVANPLDYMGFVGRGYTLNGCQGSKVVIDGVEYVQAFNTAAEAGFYYVNGELLVSTDSTFEFVANKVNTGAEYFAGKTIKLTADIDLNNKEWTPIGSATADHGFMGNFDGNGYAVKNLTITNITPDADGYVYAGLFGVTEGIDKDNQNYIKNLVIENVTIESTGDIVAAAVAYPYYTALENITVKGDVNIKGGHYTAGVLAYTRRCVNAKNISIEANEGSSIEGNHTVGGVISDIQMNGGLTANYSNFAASGLTIKGVRNVGGITGILCQQTLNGATVKNVTLVCNDARTGIVAGADGGNANVTNVAYENVTGATEVIGAPYK